MASFNEKCGGPESFKEFVWGKASIVLPPETDQTVRETRRFGSYALDETVGLIPVDSAHFTVSSDQICPGSLRYEVGLGYKGDTGMTVTFSDTSGFDVYGGGGKSKLFPGHAPEVAARIYKELTDLDDNRKLLDWDQQKDNDPRITGF